MQPITSLSKSEIRSTAVLAVTMSRQGTTRTVSVTGEMDISSTADVQLVIERALGERPETLVLDLSAMAFCDSTGVHLVIQCERRARIQRTRFLVIPPTGAARRVFDLCNVADQVTFVPSAEAASEGRTDEPPAFARDAVG